MPEDGAWSRLEKKIKRRIEENIDGGCGVAC